MLVLAEPSRGETPRHEPRYGVTIYAARISSERTWQHVIRNPFGADYADAFLLVGALSRVWAERREGALLLEAEMQAAYNFGEQHHWEFNAAPLVARWQRFPWNERVATSAAFGIGLSWSTEVPELEVELEGDSRQLLVYWMLELTAGPPRGRWAASLRLHHRSGGFGLLADDGGMNAIGIGVRYRF
jgi:hypothetical protein